MLFGIISFRVYLAVLKTVQIAPYFIPALLSGGVYGTLPPRRCGIGSLEGTSGNDEGLSELRDLWRSLKRTYPVVKVQ